MASILGRSMDSLGQRRSSHTLGDLIRRDTVVPCKPQTDSRQCGYRDAHENRWFQMETAELIIGFPIGAADTAVDVRCGKGGASNFAANTGAAVIATDIDSRNVQVVAIQGGGRTRFRSSGRTDPGKLDPPVGRVDGSTAGTTGSHGARPVHAQKSSHHRTKASVVVISIRRSLMPAIL